MTIIEVDGNNVEPLVVDSIQIFAGQRYSFVLNADQTVGNYWIRSLPPGGSYTNLVNLAVLHYDGTANENPTIDPTTDIPVSSSPLVETNLHPFTPTGVPGNPTQGGADININLVPAFDQNCGMFTMNGVAFQPPSIPVLLQILSGAQQASDLLPKGSIYGLEKDKSVELTIPALPFAGPHPIHLHGHSFHVVRSAGSSSYNYVDPVVRDVVSIGTVVPGLFDNVTIRLVADNPGPWFLHCHIDWHLNTGFAVVFAEDVPDVSGQDITTDAWKNLCPEYNAFVDPPART